MCHLPSDSAPPALKCCTDAGFEDGLRKVSPASPKALRVCETADAVTPGLFSHLVKSGLELSSPVMTRTLEGVWNVDTQE